MCFQPGQAKNTYRNGCFLLCNIGEEKKLSTHGLVTTVAYKLGKNKPTVYAMEGSVAVAGSALNWLKNNMGVLQNTEESEQVCIILFFLFYVRTIINCCYAVGRKCIFNWRCILCTCVHRFICSILAQRRKRVMSTLYFHLNVLFGLINCFDSILELFVA